MVHRQISHENVFRGILLFLCGFVYIMMSGPAEAG